MQAKLHSPNGKNEKGQQYQVLVRLEICPASHNYVLGVWTGTVTSQNHLAVATKAEHMHILYRVLQSYSLVYTTQKCIHQKHTQACSKWHYLWQVQIKRYPSDQHQINV